MSFSLIASAGALLIASVMYFYLENKKQKNSLPPRAPGYLPLIGHLLQLVKPVPVHELFFQWSQKAGPIYTCYFGSQCWVILNSEETIKDLIVNRGTVYSSRNLPDTLVHDYLEGDKGGGFAFFPYGSNWRRLRRIAHSGLVKHRINVYQPILDERRTTLLSHLYHLSQTAANAEQGVNPTSLIEHYTMTSILTIAYGNMWNFNPGDLHLHEAFSLTERAANSMSPSDQIREFFPFIQKVWPVKREKYIKLRDDFNKFYGVILREFKDKMTTDITSVQDCFVKEIIQTGELTDLQIMHFIGIFIGAGSDTTASVLKWLIVFLANFPGVQDKAFEDIKNTVGLHRLPSAEDESRLPYIQCIILETLRMRPPAPIAIPHATSKDDIYKNWFIPKDTIIVLNLYAVNNNSTRFPNPTVFDPERHRNYVEQSQKKRTFSQSVEDRPHLSFSAGRRVCVGIHLAERNLFMAASMLLSCFKFERISDALIDADTPKDIRATTWCPSSYSIRLVPRHNSVGSFF